MGPRWSIPFLVLVGLIAGFSLSGQDTAPQGILVLGEVQDIRLSTPVRAATVVLTPEAADRPRRETRTDQHGRFRLESVLPGRYRLEVQFLGYHPIDELVTIPRDGPMELKVEIVPDALELDPVVVASNTSGRLERTGFFDRRDDRTGSFFVREELREMAATGLLSDVFQVIPGVRVQHTPFGQPSRVVLRGGCEPALYLDGNELIAGTPVDEVMNAYDLEGMEVYRGIMAPPQFSTGTCGAIVMWTREPGRGAGDRASLIFPTFTRAVAGLGALGFAVYLAF